MVSPPPAVRILTVAGEASGDVHLADLLRELRRFYPALDASGAGGAESRAQGLRTIVDTADIAAMGLTEIRAKARGLWRAYRRLRRELATGPDLLVLVDFPEFNLVLARAAKRFGVPVFYYVSPQVWAWRRGRVRKILERVDRLAVLFPFEPAAYGDSPKVSFVGHPLVDRVRAKRSRAETLALHGLDPARPLVALLPGSRHGEVERILPELVGAASRLAAGRSVQFAIALAPTVERALAQELAGGLPIVENDTYELVAAADLALTASGTATVEIALLGCPMVVVYRVSALTFFFAMRLVDLPAFAMPNLIAGRTVVPELLQEDAHAERIAEEAAKILDDERTRSAVVAGLAEVRAKLGASGAASRAAELARELIRR